MNHRIKETIVAAGVITCGGLLFAGPYDRSNGFQITEIIDGECPSQAPDCGWSACEWAEKHSVNCAPEGEGCDSDGYIIFYHNGTCNYSGGTINSTCACW